MTLQTIPGDGLWMPPMYRTTFGPAFSTNLQIDATGEKIAFVGRFWHKDRTSKDVRNVGFRFGSVTKAGGSALTVSLQTVDAATGPVIVPDETQDQTVAIANANASFASNTWIETGNLSADRTLAHGELVAVVIEYDGSGRLGADSVIVNGVASGGSLMHHQCNSLLKTAGWVSGSAWPNVVLKCTDGSYGTLAGAMPCSAIGTHTFKQDTGTADEYALEFQIPFPCKLDGASVLAAINANTSNFDVILYDGTTPMTNGTVSIDANQTDNAGNYRWIEVVWAAEITLSANHTYRLAMKPTQTTTNCFLSYFDVSDANHLQAWVGGTGWVQNSRLDEGAWGTASTTRRPFMALHISALDDGAGSGGGGGLIIAGRGGLAG